MTQEGGLLNSGTAVLSAEGTFPVLINGVSGVVETGNITISVDGSVPTQFNGNTGSATPSSHILTVTGTGGTTVTASGSTLTIDSTAASGVLTLTATAPLTANGLSGSAQSGAVTIAANAATTTTLGVASFNATNFTVTAGAVTSNNFTITAGTGLSGGGSITLGGSTTLNLSTPVSGANGGTGVANTGLTINLGSGAVGKYLASDSSGNGTWATLSSAAVTSISATSPITASASTGAVTIALTTPLALNFGGTNANLTASNGGIFYSTASAGAILAGTATAGQHLQSGASSAPSWTTATYPSTATGTGTILRADGTNWVATTATYPATTIINQILYSSAANTIGGITASNNGVLISGTTGIPSWLAAGTTGQVLVATTSNPASWAALSGIAVTSITGTANQITASASVGSVTLSFPATGGISIGSYQATTSPVGGIIAPGTIGIGTASPATNAKLQVSGSTTATAGGAAYGTIIQTTITGPPSSAADVIQVYLDPLFVAGAGTTTNMYGLYITSGTTSTNPTNGYGLYVNNPAFGGSTHKAAIYTDNLSVGYTATTPPTLGAIISGQVGINASSINDSSNFLQVGNSALSSSSNYIAIDAANAVDKGIQWYSAGTSRVFAILPGGSPTVWQLTTGTQMIGVDLSNNRTMIGTGTSLSQLGVNGGVAIGTYSSANSAPSNGLIISGQVGVGTASPGNNGYLSVAGSIGITGSANLPTAAGAFTWLASGFTSPNCGRLYIGDGTGWIWRMAKRSASTDTDLFYFKDDGTSGFNTSPNSSALFATSSTLAYNHYLIGTQTGVDGSTNQAASYVNPTLQPTNGATISAAVYTAPVIITPSTKTTTVACGHYVSLNTGSNVGTISSLIGMYLHLGNLTVNGTISSAYNLYVNQPLANASGNYYAASIQGGYVGFRSTTSGDYTLTTANYLLAVTSTAAARNVNLPATAPDSGWMVIVKDESGGAATNNITINRNGRNIDGAAANKTINTNYGVIRIYSDGSNYFTW